MEKKEAMKILKDFHDKSALFSVRTALETLYPELCESEDEKIRKEISKLIMQPTWQTEKEFNRRKELVVWLEKQGEHANFRNKIQIGDKVTRNKDGVLVNLSQLKRVAKKDEKQSEQKPADWSEEDENGLGDALWCCKQAASIAKDENDMGNVWYAEHWLKSFKERYTWKPSDAQMKALDSTAGIVGILTPTGVTLCSLYHDLEKLKGE